MKKFILSAVAALCASAAMAAPVVTSGTLTRGQFEYVPTVTSNISAPVLSGFQNVYAGAMRFTFDGGLDVNNFPLFQSFLAFCIDLTSYAGAQGVGIVYDKVDFVNSLNPYDKIGKLITANGGMASVDASGSAAMQLAVWNIMYDNDLTVDAGTFRALTNTGTDVNVKANALLASANGLTQSLYDVSLLSDNYNNKFGSKQDYITASINPGFGCEEADACEIPEPGSFALAGLGLLGLCLTRRRKAT